MKQVLLSLTLMLSITSCGVLYKKLGGNFNHSPLELNSKLSKDAKELITNSFKGINPKFLVDSHFHLVGLGTGGTGVWVNPEMTKWYHLGKFNRFNTYLSASGITDKSIADQQYVKRLIDLHKTTNPRIKSFLLAFDYHYDQDGTVNKKHSEFYVPNKYMWSITQKYPEFFTPVVSIHPYRTDALIELEKWARLGVKYVKWLPNAMGIDPAHKKVIPFYKLMLKYDMRLITHGGVEKAVEAEAFQKFGNPLRLKTALDMGLKIIVSHLASLGSCANEKGENEQCFDVFWKLFNNKKYENNLFTDLSGTLIYTRIGRPIDTLIANPALHKRVLYGSDYPLPAVNFLYRTSALLERGYITKGEKELLNEIYDYHPLLFHFVLLKTIKHPVSKKGLSPYAFELPVQLRN